MLKDIIRSKGLKQKFIAEKLGVSQVTLSNWAQGKALPTEENLSKLAQILGVGIDQLKKAITHG